MERKILVTGTRGKSSMVRLLAGGFRTAGISCWARITGVIPTELSPSGTKRIQRSAPASIEELKWWLRKVPENAGAVVVENSAVSPELQGLAARWLKPDLVIWINALADHQEIWGPGKEDARRVLVKGIPVKTPCLLGPELYDDTRIRMALSDKGCPFFSVDPGGDVLMKLALSALKHVGVETPAIDPSLVPEDPGAFRILGMEEGLLAFAFSANEPDTTEAIWKATGWDMTETTLLYNHRRDRPGRLKAFLSLLEREEWRDVLITGSHPFRRMKRARFVPLSSPEELEDLVRNSGRIFGCGNVAGFPLKCLERWRKEEHPWTVN